MYETGAETADRMLECSVPVQTGLVQRLEAPPGFEPGMEVLQSGRPQITLLRKQAQNERSQSHAVWPVVRRRRQESAAVRSQRDHPSA